jgi:glycosyltransferase involved in cell wall biosynthesis
VHVLLDYRPALRERSGVGEYVHELAAALADRAGRGDTLALFTSSWKDRPSPDLSRALPGVTIHDRRVPVRLLNWCWHRVGGPAVERLTASRFDVVHAAHPLLIPARDAARVVTIHDLEFLDATAHTHGEIRRDYARLARAHARKADAVLTSSEHSARHIAEALAVPADRVTVAAPGPPRWAAAGRRTRRNPAGYLLFIGTLQPRKNLGTLLDAYERLLAGRPDLPMLKVAGRRGPSTGDWLRRMAERPLAGHAEYLGYVPDAARRALFEGASVLIIPSWHEGYGLPALEAMALGLPVVASNRGALPEVLGDAGVLVSPEDGDALAEGIRMVLEDHSFADACVKKGLARAAGLSWNRAADIVWALYVDVVERRKARHARRG